MSFETFGNTSFEKQSEQILAPELQKIFDSLSFRGNPDTLKKLASLSPEAQIGLLQQLKIVNDDHQYHIAAIQKEANNEYLGIFNNGISQT